MSSEAPPPEREKTAPEVEAAQRDVAKLAELHAKTGDGASIDPKPEVRDPQPATDDPSDAVTDPPANATTLVREPELGEAETKETKSAEETSSDDVAVAEPVSIEPSKGPRIERLDPDRGPVVGGTRVVVHGERFEDGAKVEIAGVELPATFVSDGEISFVTPPRIEDGEVEVRVVVGDARSDAKSYRFERAPTPTIVSVAPAEGPVSGGTELTIAGLNFVEGCGVRVGDIEAQVSFDAAIQLRVVAPPRTAPGRVDVRVELPDGQVAVAEGVFEYARPRGPKIERVEPPYGPAIGGTQLSVYGRDFADGCVVEIGGTPVAATRDGDRLVLSTPARKEGGPVWISVKNPDGQLDVLSDAFEYAEPRDPPLIESVWPRRSAPEKPARIEIEGRGFDAPCRVEVGGVAAQIDRMTAKKIVAIVPPRAAVGEVDVRVVNADGQSHVLPSGFAWAVPPPPPAVASVQPSTGPVTGGTSIALIGVGFDDRTYVEMAGEGILATLDASGRLIFTSPPVKSPGPVDIRLMRSDGETCAIEGAFTYQLLEAPQIHAVEPTKGPVTGGTKVIVEGSGFQKPMTAIVGRDTKATATVESATRVVVTMPPFEAGFADLVLVAPDGQRVVRSKAFQYEKLPAPVVERWDPKYGGMSGGWKITVEGKHFAVGCMVLVAGQVAKTKRVDEKTLEAIVPPLEAQGFADVAVRNPDGQTATQKNAVQIGRR